MNSSLRRTLSHLLFLVCIGTTAPLLAQDHIVEFNGNVIPGDVTEPTLRKKGAPNINDKIHFNPEGKGGQKTYGPTNIKGYYLKRLNVSYATKIILPEEVYAFFPEFTPGDDSAHFHKVTGLEVKAIGKIKLYKLVVKDYAYIPPSQPFGTGSSEYMGTVFVYYVEKDGKLILFSFDKKERIPVKISLGPQPDQLQEKQWLATFIQDDQALVQRLLYQQKKLTSEFLEECIQRYNSTYTASPSGSETGDAGK